MSTQVTTIQRSLPLIARAVGRNVNVKVYIGCGPARTDYVCIYLPALPLDDPELAILALGYILHEAAHIRWSVFFFNDVYRSPFHRHITEVLEDIRIEGRCAAEYPGFKADLARLVEKLVRDGEVLTAPNPEAHPAGRVRTWMLYAMRAEVLGQRAVAAYAVTAERLVRDILPESTVVLIRSVMGRVAWARSTMDCLTLAEEVINIIEEADQDAEPKSDGDGSEQGAGQGDPEQGDPAGAEGGKRSDQTQGKPAKDPSNGTIGRQILDADDSDIGARDFGQAVADQLSQQASDIAPGQAGGISQGVEGSFGIGDPGALLSATASATGALRARLKRFLLAQDHSDVRHRVRGRTLARDRVVQAALGQRRVFAHTDVRVQVNTDVVILLDKSDSMSGRMDVARSACLAATAALKEVRGVNVCTAAFPDASAAAVRILTPFSAKMRETANRYPALNCSGGTPLLGAFLWAVEQLMTQPGERKLVMLIMDGQPSQRDVCAQAIKMADAGGIEVLGVGIMVETISHLVPRGVCINHIDELPGALFAQLQAQLVKNRVA